MGTAEHGRRGRGRPLQIDRRRIVDAALEVGLENLTMRNVAAHLGVHPSALNYHVASREELIDAVAMALVEDALDPAWMPAAKSSWQAWVRAFAVELRRILLEHRPLALYFRFRPGPEAGGLEQFDKFLGRLYEAGFDETDAPLAAHYVSQMVFMSVRDQVMAEESGGHPQDAELRQKLSDVPAGRLPNVRRLLAGGGHGDPDAQFAFNLECVVAGLEAKLKSEDA